MFFKQSLVLSNFYSFVIDLRTRRYQQIILTSVESTIFALVSNNQNDLIITAFLSPINCPFFVDIALKMYWFDCNKPSFTYFHLGKIFDSHENFSNSFKTELVCFNPLGRSQISEQNLARKGGPLLKKVNNQDLYLPQGKIVNKPKIPSKI